MGAAVCSGGVDNQLPTLADAIGQPRSNSRAQIADMIANNRTALLVRLGDVNTVADDASVTVHTYLAYPAFSADCTSVLPGRAYSISSRSLTGSVDYRANARCSRAAAIVNGRRITPRDQAAASVVTFPLSIQGRAVDLSLHGTQPRFDVATNGIGRGAIGGYILVNELVDAVAALAPSFSFQVDTLLRGAYDTGALADGRIRRSGGMSAAFDLNGVPATASSTAPAVPMLAAGTCGTGTGTGAGTVPVDASTDASVDASGGKCGPARDSSRVPSPSRREAWRPQCPRPNWPVAASARVHGDSCEGRAPTWPGHRASRCSRLALPDLLA